MLQESCASRAHSTPSAICGADREALTHVPSAALRAPHARMHAQHNHGSRFRPHSHRGSDADPDDPLYADLDRDGTVYCDYPYLYRRYSYPYCHYSCPGSRPSLTYAVRCIGVSSIAAPLVPCAVAQACMHACGIAHSGACARREHQLGVCNAQCATCAATHAAANPDRSGRRRCGPAAPACVQISRPSLHRPPHRRPRHESRLARPARAGCARATRRCLMNTTCKARLML